MKRLCVLLLLAAGTLAAQTTLRGTVIDGDDSLPMVGATVTAPQLKRTTRSDIHGLWQFRNIPRGRYFIAIRAVGHRLFRDTLSTDSASTVVLAAEDVHQQDVVVTASAETPHVEASHDTRTIRGVDLDRVKGEPLAQSLQIEPGIAMRSNGGAAVRPVIRGLGDQRVTILLDGLPSGDLSGSAPDHAVTIDPDAATQIDILRGAPSLVYASNALTGIINVIEDDIPSARLESAAHSAYIEGSSVSKSVGAGISLAQAFGPFAVKARGTWHNGGLINTPSGEIRNSDARAVNGGIGLAYFADAFTVGASFRKFSERYGIPVPADSVERSILNPDREQLHAQADWQIGDGTVHAISAAGSYTWYTHDERDRPTNALLTAFGLKTGIGRVSASLEPFVAGGQSTAGISVAATSYSVTGDEKLTPNGATNDMAAFIVEEAPIGDVRVNAGVRAERSALSIDADSTLGFRAAQSHSWMGLFGSAGAMIPLNDVFAVKLDLSQSFRVPGMEELASNNTHDPTASFDIGSLAQSPSAVLRSERGIGANLTLEFHATSVHGEFTVYDNEIANFIYRAFRGDSIARLPVYEYRQTDARLFGAELKTEWDFGRGFYATALADLVRGVRTSDNTNLPQIPPARLALEMQYTGDLLWCGAEVRGTFKQVNVSPEEIRFAGSASGAQTPGNAVLNLNAGVRLVSGALLHSLSVHLDNALNQPYRDPLSVSRWFALQPGVSLVARYQVVM